MQGSLARLQEGCGGVAAGIAAHLVHLVQQQQPVPYACALHRLPNSQHPPVKLRSPSPHATNKYWLRLVWRHGKAHLVPTACAH